MSIYNIYRVFSPFTSRTVYYPTPGLADFVTVRNPFVTNQLPPGCDSQLFGGDDYNLLNSLDPVESPVIFEFKSDDTTCSGYFSNPTPPNPPILATLELKFFGAPLTTSITLFGEVFIAVPTVINQNEFLDNTNSDILVANSLINAIQSNIALNWRYTVTLLQSPGNVSVLLTANYPGTQYNFTTQTFVRNPSLPPFPAPQDIIYDSKDASRGMRFQNFGYKMFLEVWEQENEWLRDAPIGNAKLITTLEQTWNSSNIFVFDISKFFKIQKSISRYPDPTAPVIFTPYSEENLSTVLGTTILRESNKSYYLKWGEMFTGGVDSGVRNITGSITGFVLTITAFSGGPIKIGMTVTGAGVTFGTVIGGFVGGTFGGIGIYNVLTASPATGSIAMTLTGFEGDPVETDPWNITNKAFSKVYLNQSEDRWISNGLYPLGILILFNDHPEYWLSVNKDVPNIANIYQTIKVSQDYIIGPLVGQSGMETRYKLRRRTDAPEFLALWVHNDKQYSNLFDLRIRTDWRFIDGSSDTTFSHQTNANSISDLYQCDISLPNIGLPGVEAANSSRVLYWIHEVEIRRDGIIWEPLSEPVYFLIDSNSECDKYYTIWWTGDNGTTESFAFEGLFEMSLDYSAKYYQKSYSNTLYERNQHINQAITKVPRRRFKLNTGWLTKDQFEWLESLLRTNFVWWDSTYRIDFYFGSGNLFPVNFQNFEAINIVDSSYELDNTTKLFNMEIVIEYAVSENTSFS